MNRRGFLGRFGGLIGGLGLAPVVLRGAEGAEKLVERDQGCQEGTPGRDFDAEVRKALAEYEEGSIPVRKFFERLDIEPPPKWRVRSQWYDYPQEMVRFEIDPRGAQVMTEGVIGAPTTMNQRGFFDRCESLDRHVEADMDRLAPGWRW